jgi:protein-disulfide isomerase
MLRSLALCLLILAAPASAAAQAPRSAASTDWTQRIERTAEGGTRMGNPAAPVKLVEYASITCSHCADFHTAASPALRSSHIRSGQVSWEVRPYLIFPSDPGLFLLMQCARPADFFALSDELYAGQAAWAQRIEADEARLRAMPAREQMAAVVRASGTEAIFRARGMSDAQINACLADQSGLNRLIANHQRYARAGVDATPTFFINGRQVEAGTWAQLEPLLAAARPAPGQRPRRRGR